MHNTETNNQWKICCKSAVLNLLVSTVSIRCIEFSNLTCGVIPTGDHAEKPSKESVFDEPI
jgi:hypothetical protein